MATHKHLTAALEMAVNIARCVALKRALAAADPDPALNFWRVLHGNLLDIAVLDWCKLFGSNDEEHQQVHWKKIFADEAAFRAGLLAHNHLDQNAWDGYWQVMKNYRDQQVAHLDFNRRDVMHYPNLEPALLSVFFYYSRLIAELRALGEARFPDDLSTYHEAFLAQAAEIARAATACTSRFEDRVR
jgi:hypothetical protein